MHRLLISAFERVLPELLQLPEKELRQVALEIPGAVITVYGVIKEVTDLRPRIVAELPSFDISQVDKLKDYAMALSHINDIYLAATKTPDDFEDLVAEATKLRERYLSEARALTHHGVVREGALNNLKGANGRKNIAVDLGVLVGILRAASVENQGKILTSLEELEHASRVSTRIQEVLGVIEQGPSVVAEVTAHRLRAYTKLMNVYESIQRAIAYLRGAEYDADTIVPTLFRGRPASRAKEDDTTVPADDVTAPVAGTTPSASPSAPNVSTTAAFAADAFGPNGPFMPTK